MMMKVIFLTVFAVGLVGISGCSIDSEGLTGPDAKQSGQVSGPGPAPEYETVAQWPLDEANGSVAHDVNGSGHDGEILGAVWTQGVGGTGLEFDGLDDYVAMDPGAWLALPKGTFEAWVWIHPDETGGRIAGNETTGWQDGFYLGYNTETSTNHPLAGGIICGIHSTEGGGHYAEAFVDNVSKGAWHHVAFAWNADLNSLLVYVDGRVGTATSPHPGARDTGEPLTLACWQNGGNRGGWFNGRLDSVALLNRDLSVEELDDRRVADVEARIDIKPGSCRNPVNPRSRGKLPVVLLGGADFDVEDVDRSSLQLAGAAPVKWVVEDVAGPGNCSEQVPDGYDDLVLKFPTQDVIGGLGPLTPGDQFELTLTGMTMDDRSFSATDQIVVVGGGPDPNPGVVILEDDFNGQLDLNIWVSGTNSSGGSASTDGDGLLLINSGHQFGGGSWVDSIDRFPTFEEMSLIVTCQLDYPNVGDDDDAFWGFFRQDATGISFVAFRVIGGPEGPRFLAKVRNGEISEEFEISTTEWQSMNQYRIEVAPNSAEFFINDTLVHSFTGPAVPMVESVVRFDKTSPGVDRFLYVDSVSLSRPTGGSTDPTTICTLAGYEAANAIHPTSTNLGNWNAQSFKLTGTARVDSLGVNVLDVARDPGQLVLSLYENLDNGPGELIATCASIPSGTGWLMGVPDSRVILRPGEVYWLVASSTSPYGSFELEHDNEGTYLGGVNLYSYDAGISWTPRPTPHTDLIFKVLGRWGGHGGGVGQGVKPVVGGGR